MNIKKIVLILFVVSLSTFCVASAEPLFDPKTTDTLWYVWTGYTGRNIEIFCSKWDESSWTDPYKISNSTTSASTPAIALDNNKNPWIVWSELDGIKTSIYCRHYDGKMWSSITQVDDVDIYSDNSPSITIDKNNTPWITWTGSNGKNDDIYVSHWDGKNWSLPVRINNEEPVPHITSVISIDKQNNPIIVWCGFSGDQYKLFYSLKLKGAWTEQKPITKDEESLSADFPNILKRDDGIIELLWYEKNICYKSSWNGTAWQKKEDGEILLPEDFFKIQSTGPAYISWVKDGITQSIRIIPPSPQKIVNTQLVMGQLSSKTAGFTPSPSPSPKGRGEEDISSPKGGEGWGEGTNNNKQFFAWLCDFACPSLNAEVEANKYIAFGDSITYGTGSIYNVGYPPRLEQKLNENIGTSTVFNEGIPGESTNQGLARIDDILAKDNAKFILIMEGTNDTSLNRSTETIIFNLREIIKRSLVYGTTPLLATLPPREDGFDDRVRNDINPAIAKLAREKNVTLVDQYTELAKDETAYMHDYLHPNDAGYNIMAETWFQAINTLLNKPKEDTSDEGGCGAVPPFYRGNNSNGMHGNISLLGITSILLLGFRFYKRRLEL